MVLDIIMKNGKDFFFNLDVVNENCRSIYATGIYGNVYRLTKKHGEVYVDGKFIGMASSYNCI